MLIEVEQALLLLVDVQEKLTPLVQEAESLLEKCQEVLKIANLLSIPIVVFEQYPAGLGETVPALQFFKKNHPCVSKTTFSCVADVEGLALIEKLKRKQVILIGIEAHVCVLQTAVGLREMGYDVFVVVEAVASRRLEEKQLALQRMQSVGVTLISREMFIFECLRDAKHEKFKEISKNYLR